MKSFLKIAVIVALAAVAGKYGYDFYLSKSSIENAESRVTSMLSAMERGDPQTALCQWSVGRPTMSMEEMKPYVDRFDRWRRNLNLMEVKNFVVQNVTQDGDRVICDFYVNGDKLSFVVKPGEPVSILEVEEGPPE